MYYEEEPEQPPVKKPITIQESTSEGMFKEKEEEDEEEQNFRQKPSTLGIRGCQKLLWNLVTFHRRPK